MFEYIIIHLFLDISIFIYIYIKLRQAWCFSKKVSLMQFQCTLCPQRGCVHPCVSLILIQYALAPRPRPPDRVHDGNGLPDSLIEWLVGNAFFFSENCNYTFMDVDGSQSWIMVLGACNFAAGKRWEWKLRVPAGFWLSRHSILEILGAMESVSLSPVQKDKLNIVLQRLYMIGALKASNKSYMSDWWHTCFGFDQKNLFDRVMTLWDFPMTFHTASFTLFSHFGIAIHWSQTVKA